jgi:UDP-N-acetylglucosamine diphosphorylase/glucosamine-1-phosphate N-acetyltransferase
MTLEELASSQKPREIRGQWIERVWDCISHLNTLLSADIPSLIASGAEGRHLEAATGEHAVFAEADAIVEPNVLFDTTDGPVYISRGSKVLAFTRVVGPTFIGAESIVTTDKVAASSIGEHCRVHGEFVSSIMTGHSNKAHDGFVGHSVIGRWVNLGAGTITSNLKNTYGSVHVWSPQGEVDTGLQFFGTMFGDHAKTGIGTPLSTGSTLGAGANVYGAVTPPKVVAPFAWGERPPYSTYRLDKFLEVARRVMSRRHVELSERQAKLLSVAHDRRWSVEPQR